MKGEELVVRVEDGGIQPLITDRQGNILESLLACDLYQDKYTRH